MPEEKFWRSTVRQLDQLIELDRNYEKGVLFEVYSTIHASPKREEIEVESLLDL